MNRCDLGFDADPIPTEGQAVCPCGSGSCVVSGNINAATNYVAEVLFEVALAPSHQYRFQVILHDGSPTPGGNASESCATVCSGLDPAYR